MLTRPISNAPITVITIIGNHPGISPMADVVANVAFIANVVALLLPPSQVPFSSWYVPPPKHAAWLMALLSLIAFKTSKPTINTIPIATNGTIRLPSCSI